MDKLMLILIFIITTLVYFPLNWRKSKYYWETAFDRKIPVIKGFAIPYVFYYIYIPLAFLLLYDDQYFTGFAVAMIYGNLSNSTFWYLFPNGVKRPNIPKEQALNRILTFFYKYDMDTNGCPSSHVLHTLIISYFLIAAFPFFWPLIAFAGMMITLSVIFTKQHNIIDIFGSILSFALSVSLAAI